VADPGATVEVRALALRRKQIAVSNSAARNELLAMCCGPSRCDFKRRSARRETATSTQRIGGNLGPRWLLPLLSAALQERPSAGCNLTMSRQV